MTGSMAPNRPCAREKTSILAFSILFWCQAFLRDGKCKFSPCKFAHLAQDQVDEIRRAHKESTERKDKQ